jgi:AraC-like DNA-binding protein
LCVFASGALLLGTEILGSDGTFDNWTAGVPNGWTLTQNSGTVTQLGSAALIDGGDVYINRAGLTIGQRYYVEVTTTDVSGSAFEVLNGGVSLIYQTVDVLFTASVRCFRASFVASATTLSIGVPVSSTAALVVDSVRLWPATPVSQFRSWIEHLMIDRAGIAAGEIDLASADASLAQIVRLIAGEMSVTRCGQPLLMNRAGDILLIGLLRHLVSQPQKTTGLFSALANPRIAKTLVAMHADASKPWSLEALADEAGMSRTTYAISYKKAMGKTPGKYLVALRLALARRALDNGKTVKEAARISGYRNPGSIARAFKSIESAKRY